MSACGSRLADQLWSIATAKIAAFMGSAACTAQQGGAAHTAKLRPHQPAAVVELGFWAGVLLAGCQSREYACKLMLHFALTWQERRQEVTRSNPQKPLCVKGWPWGAARARPGKGLFVRCLVWNANGWMQAGGQDFMPPRGGPNLPPPHTHPGAKGVRGCQTQSQGSSQQIGHK